jgi:hypothetical protein
MPKPDFLPGFRLSRLDVLVVVVGVVATLVLATFEWWWGFVVGFVLAHFFLFCNVFRLARSLELTWAGVFVLLAGMTVAMGFPGWGITAAVSLAVTLAVVAVEVRKPSYHGVGWRWINPGLPAWWEARQRNQADFARASEDA